jgi:hypothetical protein
VSGRKQEREKRRAIFKVRYIYSTKDTQKSTGVGRRNRGRPRKRWIEDSEKDTQIMGKEGGENCVRKGRNRRNLLRRLKPTVGCNASKRRRCILD